MPSDAVLLSLIETVGKIAIIVGSIASAYFAYRAKASSDEANKKADKSTEIITQVQKNTDGINVQLNNAIAGRYKAEGKIEGIAEGVRQGKENVVQTAALVAPTAPIPVNVENSPSSAVPVDVKVQVVDSEPKVK